MIVGTPRPSSPTIRAHAPRNSTSLEAFERFPSLSLSRWMWKRLRSPSGRMRGSRKHESPPSAWARTRKASHIGAEQNHLWPVISYSAPAPPPFSGLATVVLARTSEPPCFSVIAMPHSAPLLSGAGTEPLAVVGQRQEARLPLLGHVGLLSDRGDHRVGHRDRAADARLDLGEEHELRRPRDVGARAGDRATARRGAPARSRGASARARRDGTRPRRSGCRTGRGCAAGAGSGSPRRRARARPRGRRSRPSSRASSSAHSAPSRRRASARVRSRSKTL